MSFHKWIVPYSTYHTITHVAPLFTFISTIHDILQLQRNKNKELETKCKEVDKLYREERSAREELTRQLKEMKEQLQLLKQFQKVPGGGALPNNVSSDIEDVDETNENLMGMMFIDKT